VADCFVSPAKTYSERWERLARWAEISYKTQNIAEDSGDFRQIFFFLPR
jgi:hypothetical protein